VDEKNDQIAHRRIVAGREILMNYGRNNNSPETASSKYVRRWAMRFHLPALAFWDLQETKSSI
jgi:hypothetical protein